MHLKAGLIALGVIALFVLLFIFLPVVAWIILGLILVVAVILAVIIMVSTSLNGLDNHVNTVNVRATPSPTPTEQISTITVEAPPTPPPTPTPTVQDIKVFFFNTEITQDFTMHMGDEPITLTAKAYPMDQFADATFTWKSEDANYLKLTQSEDGTECSFEILATKAGGVGFTVTCNGTTIDRRVYLVN